MEGQRLNVAPDWLEKTVRICEASPQLAELDERVAKHLHLPPSFGFGNRGALGPLARDD